jgi:hypothetical protein
MNPLRIPTEHRLELAKAVDEGASVVIVRADGLPTATAIGDLFLASGARAIDPQPPPPGPTDVDELGEATAERQVAELPADGDAQLLSSTVGAREPTDAMFLPPHRRSES